MYAHDTILHSYERCHTLYSHFHEIKPNVLELDIKKKIWYNKNGKTKSMNNWMSKQSNYSSQIHELTRDGRDYGIFS